MIREILENIAGIEIWPIVGLILFFAMFVLILIWVIRLDKKKVKDMANIPLEEPSNDGDNSNGKKTG